jgi:hypothetical protein
MTDLVVKRACWKFMTNREIRNASTGSPQILTKAPRDDLFFPSPKMPTDKPHPWLLLEIEQNSETYLLAFSRNSTECQLDQEDLETLKPPYVWLNHRHDWHICKVIDSCGKVNFNLQRKSEWPTFWKVASVRAFKSANQLPICEQEDRSLMVRIAEVSNILGRFKSLSPTAPSLAFLNTLKAR